MYPPTPRARRGLFQGRQPRVTPTPFSYVPFPPRCYTDLLADSTKLSILSGATFTTLPPAPRLPTQTHYPIPFFSSLRTDRYIACRPVRRYHTVQPSEHTYPPPHGAAFPLRETTTGPTSWFFTGRRGYCGRIYCCHFFERFQAHRSSTAMRPVLVTRRCDVCRQDHFRRVSFRDELPATKRARVTIVVGYAELTAFAGFSLRLLSESARTIVLARPKNVRFTYPR